ncbi:unannotated protein [freshwater metagenome]|uniref:Unannotated protein n=1 Tax=freshwater metagenome TaxID=449393 RepID=A0A6J7RJB2_9ZZZZ
MREVRLTATTVARDEAVAALAATNNSTNAAATIGTMIEITESNASAKVNMTVTANKLKTINRRWAARALFAMRACSAL